MDLKRVVVGYWIPDRGGLRKSGASKVAVQKGQDFQVTLRCRVRRLLNTNRYVLRRYPAASVTTNIPSGAAKGCLGHFLLPATTPTNPANFTYQPTDLARRPDAPDACCCTLLQSIEARGHTSLEARAHSLLLPWQHLPYSALSIAASLFLFYTTFIPFPPATFSFTTNQERTGPIMKLRSNNAKVSRQTPAPTLW